MRCAARKPGSPPLPAINRTSHGGAAIGYPVRYIEAIAADVPHEANDDLPDFLHHYTSGQGLLGILRSAGMHCTNVLYMNDSSEMDYGRELVIRVIEERKHNAGAPRLPGHNYSAWTEPGIERASYRRVRIDTGHCGFPVAFESMTN